MSHLKDRLPVHVRSALQSNIFGWSSQNLSKRDLKLFIESTQRDVTHRSATQHTHFPLRPNSITLSSRRPGRRPGFRPSFRQVRACLRPARDQLATFWGSKAGRRQARAIWTMSR